MQDRALGATGQGAAVLAWVAVGATHLLARADVGSGALWWTLWVCYGAVYTGVSVAEARAGEPWSQAAPRWALAVLFGLLVPLAVGQLLLSPLPGLAGVLLVLNAVMMAEYLRPRVAIVAIVAQTSLMLLPGLWDPSLWEVPWTLVTAVAFLSFQGFAFVMVVSLRQAETARRESEAIQTALREAQARLAESSRTEERLRIARDLHDAVGHQLTALSLTLQVAARQASDGSREQLLLCQRLAADLLDEVRSVVGQMREGGAEPALVDGAAAPRVPGARLRDALVALGDGLPRPRLHVHVDETLPALPQPLADVVSRCVREIVTNAARHSDAADVWVSVEHAHGVVELTAHDDGRVAGPGPVVAGNGLTGMAERCAAHGGSLAWRVAPDGGFSLQASLPLSGLPLSRLPAPVTP